MWYKNKGRYCSTLLEEHDVAPSKNVRSWCDGSSDRSFMVDPLNYFSFPPVLHNWCNKGCGMCYPFCGIVHIEDSLLLIKKNSPCSGGSWFPLLLSEWSSTICPMTYNRFQMMLSASLNKIFPSFLILLTQWRSG